MPVKAKTPRIAAAACRILSKRGRNIFQKNATAIRVKRQTPTTL
jgi:hypothetical protein